MQSRALTFGTAVALAVTLGLVPASFAAGQESEDGQAEDDARALRRLPAFGALDTDDDGEISAAEIDAAPESLASLDGDGGGSLSEEELRPPGAARSEVGADPAGGDDRFHDFRRRRGWRPRRNGAAVAATESAGTRRRRRGRRSVRSGDPGVDGRGGRGRGRGATRGGGSRANISGSRGRRCPASAARHPT